MLSLRDLCVLCVSAVNRRRNHAPQSRGARREGAEKLQAVSNLSWKVEDIDELLNISDVVESMRGAQTGRQLQGDQLFETGVSEHLLVDPPRSREAILLELPV